jgi:glucokinase
VTPSSRQAPDDRVVLAGDVGGTKTVLALVDGSSTARFMRRYESRAFDAFEPIVSTFLDEAAVAGHVRPSHAAFGVAGPVADDRCATTNLPWVIDARAIAEHFGLSRAALLNDFVAAAYGVVALPPSALVSIQPRERAANGLVAVVGAGTGLGMAIVSPGLDARAAPIAHATEGGHADFAPRTDEQIDLLRFLRAKYGRVSIERVVSGLGIADLYAFQCARGVPSSDEARAAIATGDAGAEVAQWASREGDPACVATVRLFVECYGAEVGNVALRIVPRGGLFIAGGIAPRMLDALRSEAFVEAMRDKGRMRGLVEQIPIDVVLEPRVGVLGAASVALCGSASR